VSDVVNAEKCFSTLANLITAKVPQSRLAALLGDRSYNNMRFNPPIFTSRALRS